ncbi:hypothetical protein GGI12_005227, partial [Dipsacomyces acuminosporus]
GRGVDIICDFLLAKYFSDNIESLARDGRLSLQASMGGAVAEKVNLGPILFKRLRIEGTTLRSRTLAYQRELRAVFEKEVLPHIESGKVEWHIAKIFDWEDIQGAHRLLEDASFTGKIVVKRHWYPPKGRRGASEEELQCALRQTLDMTGLRTSDLVIDEAFRAELQYVDGIQPKQVVYTLARMAEPSRHSIIRCDGAGMRYQWCSLEQALEKVVYKSMQDILTQAEDYIDGMRDEILSKSSRSRWQAAGEEGGRRHQRSGNYRQYDDRNSINDNNNNHEDDENDDGPNAWRTVRGNSGGLDSRFKNLSVNDGYRGNRGYNDREQQPNQGWRDHAGSSNRDNANPSQQQQQQQQRRPQDNPLYKTKLCDKFERDGECPYGAKCVFAHGEKELRSRETTPLNVARNDSDDRQRSYAQSSLHQQQSQQRSGQNTARQYSSNPLYKTRLCQRYSEQGECPYGEKCQFAHGEGELRAAPEQPSQPRTQRDGAASDQKSAGDQHSNGFSRGTANRAQNWRRGAAGGSDDRSQNPPSARNTSWSNAGAHAAGESPSLSDDGSLDSPRYPSSIQSPMPSAGGDVDAPHAAPLVTPIPQTIPFQTGSKAAANTGSSALSPAKKSQEFKSGSFKGDADGEKPWIKVVEMSDKDLEKMGSPRIESVSGDSKQKPASKAAELETRLAAELASFFTKGQAGGQEHTLQSAFKEITHVEFRNNLSKQQLLNIVIAALFAPCKANGVSEAIVKRAELLSKIVTKRQDQAFMLNAWQRLLADDENAAAWQKKASEVLGALYEASLLDEEVFTEWFDGKFSSDCSPAIAAMKPFSDWLATAEEEQ